MPTKTVRLKEDVYERIKSKKRDDETFSEAVNRLTRNVSLLDLGGPDGESTPEKARRHRELLGQTERDGERRLDEQLATDDS